MERKLTGNHTVLFPVSSQLYSATRTQREGGKEKSKGNAQACLSLPPDFSRFSLVNWILSGAVGCAPVHPRFFYTNQPLHDLHANHRRRSCRHKPAQLETPRRHRRWKKKCGRSSPRSTSLDHARTNHCSLPALSFYRGYLDCVHMQRQCKKISSHMQTCGTDRAHCFSTSGDSTSSLLAEQHIYDPACLFAPHYSFIQQPHPVWW